jgi:branched-chain amino acid transport system permease protein
MSARAKLVGRIIVGLIGLTGLILLMISPHISTQLFWLQRPFLFYLMMWISLSLSLNIIYGYTGYLPFGYVAFYGIGAYVASILWSRLDVPIALAIIVAGLGGALLALLFAPTLRLKGIYFAIVNFSFAMALEIIVSNLPEEITGGTFGISLSRIYNPTLSYYFMLAVMLVTILAVWMLSKSRLGIALKCIKEDDEAASAMGIDVVRSRLYAWLLSATFPAFVGAIDAWNTAIIDPESSFSLSITAKSIIYSMFGGLGTVTGPIVGSTLLYTLDDIIWSIFPLLDLLLLGVLVVLLILFLPKGIIGTLLDRYRALKDILR